VNDDEWLRTARRVLVNGPQVIGLLAVGTVDTAAVAGRLAEAINRLTGELIGLVPHWRRWGQRALEGEGGRPNPAVVRLTPPAETEVLAALPALEEIIGRARPRFSYLIVDLAGLPLRHPTTVGCADAIVTVAPSGALREEHLRILDRAVPDERNLGVMLVD
jgi:hypothetical protein